MNTNGGDEHALMAQYSGARVNYSSKFQLANVSRSGNKSSGYFQFPDRSGNNKLMVADSSVLFVGGDQND